MRQVRLPVNLQQNAEVLHLHVVSQEVSFELADHLGPRLQPQAGKDKDVTTTELQLN